MTKVETISNNHMSLEGRRGHRKLVSVKELISRLNPSATIYEVVRKAKCSICYTIGAADFRQIWLPIRSRV